MSDFFNFGVQNLLVGSTAPYSGPFESSGISSIEGVQSAAFSLNWPRQDIMVWDGNGSAESVTRPTAQLDFSYIFSPEFNLNELGLCYNYTGLTNPALSSLNYEKNYYLVANMNGQDMIGYSGDNNRILALGNGLINQFSFNSAVGQPSTVSMSVEGLNLLIQTDRSNQYLPSVSKRNGSGVTEIYSLPVATRAINKYFSASPSAIALSFNTGLSFGANISGTNEIPLDSFSFSIGLARDATKDIGWAYPESRSVQWPVTISVSANGTLNNLQADYLNRYLCNTGMSFNVGFKTGCSLLSPVSFDFQGAKLDSESITSAVGDYTKISLNWSLKIFDINRKYPNFYIRSNGQNSYLSFNYISPNWIATNPTPVGFWTRVAFGNNIFVATANAGGFFQNYVVSSSDGLTWNSFTQPSVSSILDITYGNGVFVAVITPSSGTNRIMTSTDGISWTIRTTPNRVFSAITYGNNQFVAVGNNGAIMTSSNGTVWTDRTTGSVTFNLKSITYGNNLYVAIHTLGVNYAYSTDGINWTSVAKEFPLSGDIAYGNGVFVVVGISGQISRSKDGINWILFSGPNLDNYSSVAFGNGVFYAVSTTTTTTVIRSTDGLNWTTEQMPQPKSLEGITFGNGFFVAVGTDTFLLNKTESTYNLSKKSYLEVCSGPASISNGNQITIQDRLTPTVIKAIPEDGSNIQYINL